MHTFTCSHHLCQREFTSCKTGKDADNYAKKQFHFCSASCQSQAQKRGGVIYLKRREDNLKKLGVEHPMQTEATQARFKQSMLVNHGVEQPFQSPKLREKKRQTYIKNLGVDNPMKSAEIKKKAQQTNLKRYNAISPLSCREVRQKCKDTLISRYGEDNFYKTKQFKQHVADNIDTIVKKRNFTLKKNNSYGRSRAEDICFNTLTHIYGTGNVQRQISLPNHRRLIDFYIPSQQLYIQVDGIYWHRLNTSLEFLSQKNDEKGIKRVLADRAQNQWFADNNLKLIRITEVEARSSPEDLINIIATKLLSNVQHTP